MAKKDFKKSAAELFITSAQDEQAQQIESKSRDFIPKGYKLVKENKSERLQLLIRPTLKEAAKQEAAARGVSVNDLINSILEEYMERKGNA